MIDTVHNSNKNEEDKSALLGILKDNHTNLNTPLDALHFNLADKLFNALKIHRLKELMNMTHEDTGVHDNEMRITLTSISKYQPHSTDLLLFCVDIGPAISCI